MQVAAPFCALCGVPCEDTQLCRVADASAVQQILRSRCAETALHYRAVLALPPGERRPVCMFCVNWKRRAASAVGRSRERLPNSKCYTPLDSVVLHALSPGHFPEPDQRCFDRLARVAADPRNGYAALIPECVRRVLEAAVEAKAGGASPEDVQVAMLRRWWRANEGTTFFRFPETARAVRQSLLCRDLTQVGARRRWRR